MNIVTMKCSTSTIESKLIILEFITSKITSRKLNKDNCLLWRKTVEINLTGRVKKNHLYMEPTSSKTDEWEQRSCCSI